MSNEEIIAAINQFDIREVRDINGLWNTLQECRAALESRAIPDSHRVVSVEFLNVVAMIVTEARDYYSDMNDSVCPSYADPWEHAADACIELQFIVDNKEPHNE